ncbi:MFS transporter [Lentzea sp.]|uniref:MFS transporter n=1 Tax=Lentzea sp. TaxID=56099 RepID=UPI002C68F722|nr:MFS transporter [Lentzea sp.]HUQ54668.1 MFS transporter [Lentzea sp.]
MSTPARRVALLTAATAISAAGNGFGRIALTFGVLALPGATARGLSLVLVCLVVPQILFVVFGGVLADRVSRFRLLVLSDVTSALAYTGLAAGLWWHAPIPVLAVFAAVAGTAMSVSGPATSALMPEIVTADRLQRTNSVVMTAVRSADLAGTALGGTAVAVAGAPSTLLLNAVSFAASAVLLALVRLPSRVRAEATSLLTDLRLGWQAFLGRQWLWATVAALSFTSAALGATMGILGPIVAVGTWDSVQSWSLVAAASTAGMLCGAAVSARLRPGRPLVAGLLLLLVFVVPLVLLAAAASPWTVAAAMFCAGLANDVFGVLWHTTMQREVPEELLARVTSYDWLGTMVLAPVGVLVAAPLSTAFGTGPVLLGCAVVVAASSLAALSSLQVRGLRAEARQARHFQL